MIRFYNPTITDLHLIRNLFVLLPNNCFLHPLKPSQNSSPFLQNYKFVSSTPSISVFPSPKNLFVSGQSLLYIFDNLFHMKKDFSKMINRKNRKPEKNIRWVTRRFPFCIVNKLIRFITFYIPHKHLHEPPRA